MRSQQSVDGLWLGLQKQVPEEDPGIGLSSAPKGSLQPSRGDLQAQLGRGLTHCRMHGGTAQSLD